MLRKLLDWFCVCLHLLYVFYIIEQFDPIFNFPISTAFCNEFRIQIMAVFPFLNNREEDASLVTQYSDNALVPGPV
jgi:hypothetical protein